MNNTYGYIFDEVLGKVKKIDDPKKMKRVKVTIPELGMKEEEITPWALPHLSQKSDWLPKAGDIVWIRFRGGNPSKPVYTGLAYCKDQVTQEFLDDYSNENRVDYDDVGNKIQWSKKGLKITCLSEAVIELFNDKDNSDNNYTKIEDTFVNSFLFDKEGISWKDKNDNEYILNKDGIKRVDKNGNEEVFNSDGIKIKCKNGNEITKDSNGIKFKDKNNNTIEMKAGEIKLTGTMIKLLGAGEPAVLGNKLYSKMQVFLNVLAGISGGDESANAIALNAIKGAATAILTTWDQIKSQKVFLE